MIEIAIGRIGSGGEMLRLRTILFITGVAIPMSLLAQTSGGKRVAPPPIIAPPPPPIERYGDWSVRTIGRGTYMAATVNSAGSAFGVLCKGGECVIFVNPQIQCQKDHEYPALVNSAAGAFSTTLTCKYVGDLALMVMPDKASVADTLETGGTIGVAFPMESGAFQVARFSLIGGMKAARRAATLGGAGRDSQTNPSDTSL